MPTTINTIITHRRPHADEITAIWLLRKFGCEAFPGIDKATVRFVNAGSVNINGKTPEQYEQEGNLLIGIGGGRFDEHSTLVAKRKKDHCATTLVAEFLGIDEFPELQQIIKFIVNNDLKGVSHPLDIASLVKIFHSQYPRNPEWVIRWATFALEAKYKEQLEFWTGTKEEFKKAEIDEIRVGESADDFIRIATLKSDDINMSKFFRSPDGGDSDVLIQMNFKGNVLIFTDKRSDFPLHLQDAARMIRLAEQKAKGMIITTDWKELSGEGIVHGAEEWLFHQSGNMLLNGTLTNPNVPPTKLSLDEIREIIKIALNPNAFEETRAPLCKSGICSSTRNDECPWYKWGLRRCRKIRFNDAIIAANEIATAAS